MNTLIVSFAALTLALLAVLGAVGAVVRSEEAWNYIQRMREREMEAELQQILWEEDPDNHWYFNDDDEESDW